MAPICAEFSVNSFRFHLKSFTPDNANSEAVLMRLWSVGNTLAEIYLDQNLVLNARVWQAGGPTLESSFGAAVALNQWYDLAWVFETNTSADPAAPNGTFKWFVNGVGVTASTGSGITEVGVNTPGGNVDEVRLGLAQTLWAQATVVIDDVGIDGLNPTAGAPLIIRSATDTKVTVTQPFTVNGLDNLRFQGLFFSSAGAPRQLSFKGVTGPVLTSCVVQSGVLFEGCSDARIIGNTFDYRNGAAGTSIDSCTNTQFENNIVLNDGASEGVSCQVGHVLRVLDIPDRGSALGIGTQGAET